MLGTFGKCDTTPIAPALAHNWASTLIESIKLVMFGYTLSKTGKLRCFQIQHNIYMITHDVPFAAVVSDKLDGLLPPLHELFPNNREPSGRLDSGEDIVPQAPRKENMVRRWSVVYGLGFTKQTMRGEWQAF